MPRLGILPVIRFRQPAVLAAASLCVFTTGLLSAASPDEMRFFEEQVRPILATKCLQCHGEEKQKGGLRLDSPDAILAGGDSGPAIEPGKPNKSLLVEAINYESIEMPPDEKLPPEEIATLQTWIKMGAPWPNHSAKGAVRKEEKITDDDRNYWAFQPVRTPRAPEITDQGWS